MIQIPSNATGIRLTNIHTFLDSLGYWHLQGMIQNVGNKTIQELTVTATVYNTAMQPIDSGSITVADAAGIIFHPGDAKQLDVLGNSLGIAGQGYFKLSYSLQYA